MMLRDGKLYLLIPTLMTHATSLVLSFIVEVGLSDNFMIQNIPLILDIALSDVPCLDFNYDPICVLRAH